MIITRENLNEEVSNLNDEILNLEKKYGVNIIALAQVESLDNERAFYDEEVPPENAGETFKKLLVKEVAKNEH